MNKLEKLILGGARNSHSSYMRMTDNWLWHAPESYIMVHIAKHVFRQTKTDVYADCSPKKIKSAIGPRPGRPSRSNRFDLVIWQKNKNRKKVRAVIEIKKNPNMTSLKADKKKLCRYRKSNKSVAIYLLGYTEACGKGRMDTLENRGTNWATGLDCKLVGSKYSPRPDEDEHWDWAIHLLRINN